jgi:hypothetical protein
VDTAAEQSENIVPSARAAPRLVASVLSQYSRLATKGAPLPTVFISYSRDDSPVAHRLSESLRNSGLSVWIDATGIEEGRAYDRQIETALKEAKCVLVLWSKSSVESEWVRNEAAEAYENDKLIPVLLEVVQQPLQFRSVQAIDFTSWDGTTTDKEFVQLRSAIERRMGNPSALPGPAEPVSKLSGLRTFLEAASLRFASEDLESRFSKYFTQKYLAQSRMHVLLLAALYSLFAILDFIDGRGTPVTGVFQTVVTPILIGAFLLSLWSPIVRFWRPFVLFVGSASILLIILSSRRVVVDGAMAGEAGVFTTALLIDMIVIGAAPFRFIETVIICAIPLLFQWQVESWVGIHSVEARAELELVTAGYVAFVVAAWWRERLARKQFLESSGSGRR